MHRAGQRCFELLALISSPQLLYQSYFSAVVVFLLQNDDKQTEHNMSQLFSMLINFYSLIKGIPQLDKTLGRTGLPQLDKTLAGTGQSLRACTVAEAF